MLIETIVIIVSTSLSGLILGGTTIGLLEQRRRRLREMVITRLNNDSITEIIMYAKPYKYEKIKK